MPDKIKWSSLDRNNDGKASYAEFWDGVMSKIAYANKDGSYRIEANEVNAFNALGLPSAKTVFDAAKHIKYYTVGDYASFDIETYIQKLYTVLGGRKPVTEALTGLTLQSDKPLEKEKVRQILSAAGINFIDFDR